MTHATTTTVVIDAGARYGMHPSWRDFGADLVYFAFEPDAAEVRRLRAKAQPPGLELIEAGLADREGERQFRMTRHRGTSSFLEVDDASEWFGRYRPGEGALDEVVTVKTHTADGFAASRGVAIDFMKIDTEGTELEVLEGAHTQLAEALLGLRINVSFQRCYRGQALFTDLHTHLLERGFFLLNLDYFGRGVPRNALFRNPDPLAFDMERYGTLIGTDAVWLREYGSLVDRFGADAEALQLAVLKYAAFCFLNHGPDVAVDTLLSHVRKNGASFVPAVAGSPLYRYVRRTCAEFIGRWRTYPDAQWETCRDMFRTIFGLELEGGHRYWELIQGL